MQPLRDSTDLRDSVQQSLCQFREDCGQAPISNLKQCIRMLATRIQGTGISLELYIREQVTIFTLSSSVICLLLTNHN